jgi:hypothetical protein
MAITRLEGREMPKAVIGFFICLHSGSLLLLGIDAQPSRLRTWALVLNSLALGWNLSVFMFTRKEVDAR